VFADSVAEINFFEIFQWQEKLVNCGAHFSLVVGLYYLVLHSLITDLKIPATRVY
jgi:hypothetical protein